MTTPVKNEIIIIRPGQQRVCVYTNEDSPPAAPTAPAPPASPATSEDCIIIDNEAQVTYYSTSDSTSDLFLLAEKGQVACRDYPHPRHLCLTYPFNITAHELHCHLCYCFVCDIPAPCKLWIGVRGHCHALDTRAWQDKRDRTRKIMHL